MGDKEKVNGEGAKPEPVLSNTTLDTLLAAITGLQTQMNQIQQESKSQKDTIADVKLNLAGGKSSEGVGEKDKEEPAESTETRKEIETQDSNESASPENRTVDGASQNYEIET